MPSRRTFIQSHGATCRNWAWSWAFIDQAKEIVIFGAWDINTSGGVAKILDERWERSAAGRRNPAYPEALEYLGLVESGAYRLMTFTILYSDKRQDSKGMGPASIRGIVPTLTECGLSKVGSTWFATPTSTAPSLPEEVTAPGTYVEGSARTVLVNAYERDPKARVACIAHYGARCCVCLFEFGRVYGSLGKDYIHVHHLVPLATIAREYELDPIADLRPVCPNCHAMLHKQTPPLSLDELRGHMKSR